MEICGIQFVEDLEAINTIIDYQSVNPQIEILIDGRKSNSGSPFKITIQTCVDGVIYASVRFYVANKTNIHPDISTKIEISLIKESIKHHIEYIKEMTSKNISESFYERRMNQVVYSKLANKLR